MFRRARQRPLPCHVNPFHPWEPYSPKIHFNIILPHTPRFSKWTILQAFQLKFIRILNIPFMLHALSILSFLMWKVQTVQPLTKQSSPPSLLHPHTFLRGLFWHPQSTPVPWCDTLSHDDAKQQVHYSQVRCVFIFAFLHRKREHKPNISKH
jgi:hypothetical protein